MWVQWGLSEVTVVGGRGMGVELAVLFGFIFMVKIGEYSEVCR